MMTQALILALDLATRTGWALGRPGDATPLSGSVRFAREGASMGAVFAGCRNWLGQFLDEHDDVELIVFEAPMDPMLFVGRPRRPETARQLIGLAAIVEERTYDRGYDVREARVSDIRRHFIGANLKRRAAKDATIEACRRLGWAPVDDNAADALALWHYQASILDPKLALQTSPLFRRRCA